MELKVAPICGRDYRVMEKHGCIVKKSLFGSKVSAVSPFRGICWNPLTRCLLVCDVVKCCVHSFGATFNSDQTEELKMALNESESVVTIGTRGSGPGQFLNPVAVAVNLRGEIAVADGKLNRVQIFSGSGDLEHLLGRPGTGPGELRGVSDLKFVPRGYLAIVDSGNHRIQVMTATGIVVQVIGRYGWKLGELMNPCAIAVNGKGEMFVCDEGNKRIQRFSDRGNAVLEWGSRRGPTPNNNAMVAAGGVDITELRPVVYSVFSTPCDLVVGRHGEIIVCDSGRRELLIFSDVGKCLHVVSAPHIFQSHNATAVAICSNMLIAIGKQVTGNAEEIVEPQDNKELLTMKSFVCLVVAFPPVKRVRVGQFEPIPVHCTIRIVCYLKYHDALQLRLVSHYFHQICRGLRNQWKLFPLTPGQATVKKYNRIVSSATGLVAVEEAFQKWGLRIYKPSNHIRKHVMDFQAGFCSALSSLYGPMFWYQHEELLRALFRFYASRSSTFEKEEIDRTRFIEIVTQIEEVRWKFRAWEQCTPFTAGSGLVPAIRSEENIPRPTGGVPLPKSLQLVENAQQQHLSKLLQKFNAL